MPLSISWVKTLREELVDESFEDDGNNSKNGSSEIEDIVDEICGFARIDRALLKFLPKNAVKRAAFTLDLASKVLEQFTSKASPIAYIHSCSETEARALQDAVYECFGEDAEDAAANAASSISRSESRGN